MPKQLPTMAWQNGIFTPFDDVHVPLNDAGFRQGVVAVERLRTYHGAVAALEAHIVRWRRTLEELYISMSIDVEMIERRIDQLLKENQGWLNDVGDCGIVMLATPGSPVEIGSIARPNEMMHLIAIDHQKVERHRVHGQPLFVTNVEQPSGKCWPRDIKVRCRLHYYLADQQAHEHHLDSVGLLVDHDGTVTESSVANIAIVKNGKVMLPPIDQVLPGITQQIVQSACVQAGVSWQYERLWPAEIREADEVWLMGTDGGLWFANRVDGAKIATGGPGNLYSICLPIFDQMIREH